MNKQQTTKGEGRGGRGRTGAGPGPDQGRAGAGPGLDPLRRWGKENKGPRGPGSYKIEPKSGPGFWKTGPERDLGLDTPVFSPNGAMTTQNKPYFIFGKPNLGRSWQIWGYVGNSCVNLLETMYKWLQMAMLKRCAPKNDPENRWNFVKWTNGDPKTT